MNLFYAVFIECGDIIFCERLKEVFISYSACRIAGAFFLLAEDAKRNFGLLQAFYECLGYFFSALVERAGTTDKIEVFNIFIIVERLDTKPLAPLPPG